MPHLQSLSSQSICPVTGLPITRNQNWVRSNPKTGFRGAMAWISDQILLSQPQGNLGLTEAKMLTRLVTQLVREAQPPGKALINIIDYAQVTHYSLEARQHFAQQNKRQFPFQALIFCNASPLLGLSINLAQKHHPAGQAYHLVQDYNEAILLAVEILGRANARPATAPLRKPLLPPGLTQAESALQVDYPLTSEPAWCGHVALSQGFANFSRIGQHLLVTRPVGDFDAAAAQALAVKQSQLAAQAPFAAPVHGILDASCQSFASLRHLVAPANNVSGLADLCILVPQRVKRWGLAAWASLTGTPHPRLVGSLDHALQGVLVQLGRLHPGLDARITPARTEPTWSAKLGDFEVCYHLLGNNILHAETHGFLQVEVMDELFALQERVVIEAGLAEGDFYFIGGVSDLELGGGTWKARRLYQAKTVDFFHRYPLKAYVFYGVDAFLASAINRVTPLIAFPVHIARDLEQALAFIGAHRLEQSYQLLNRQGWPQPDPAAPQPLEEQILAFLSQIDWESHQPQVLPQVPPGHPLQRVFEAIRLIKTDLNEMQEQRMQTAQAWQEQQASLSLAQESAQTASFEWDSTNGVTHCSENFYHLLGLEPFSLQPTFKTLLDHLTAEDCKTLQGPLLLAMYDAQPCNYKLHLRLPQGGQRVLRFRGQPRGQRYLVTLQDITEANLLEQQLHQLQHTTNQALLVRDQFLSNLSHELRTPLNGICGFTELLAATQLDAEQQDYLTHARKAAQELFKSVSEILDYADLQSAPQVIAPETFSLAQLAEDLEDRIRPLAAEKNLSFGWQLSAHSPVTLFTDRHFLLQLLLDLLDNAVKFSNQGEIRLDIALEEASPGRQALAFRVSDSGCGFDLQNWEFLLEPFTQGDGTYCRHHRGLGLGLAAVKRLAQLLGGHLTATSQRGQGSCFVFHLPCPETDDARAKVTAAASPLQHAQVLLLAAADQPYRTWLQTWGCQVKSLPVEAVAWLEPGQQAWVDLLVAEAAPDQFFQRCQVIQLAEQLQVPLVWLEPATPAVGAEPAQAQQLQSALLEAMPA